MPGFLCPKEQCPHCKSAELESYGYTFGGMHFYSKCPHCHKFIEYRAVRKFLLLADLFIFLILLTATIIAISLLDIDTRLAISFVFGSILLSIIVGYKYRRYSYEVTVHDNLPDDLCILRVPSRKIGLIYAAILVAAILTYAGIFCFNLARQ